MKCKLICTIAATASLLASCGASAKSDLQRTEINQGWTFSRADSSAWLDASVPGTVHTDLLAAGVIEDPFYRDNELKLQWIDKKDWIYKTIIKVDDKELDKNRIEILFEGLDTYADVYLNDSKIISADNMFRTWRADVKQVLKSGDNELKVYFHSPIRVALAKYDSLSYQLPCFPTNDQSYIGGLDGKMVNMHNRKTASHFGWDWGPRFVTSGIWKPAYLISWNGAKIENIHYQQGKIDKEKAEVLAVVELDAAADENVMVKLSAKGDKLAEQGFSLKKGLNVIELPVSIKNPELWYPAGSGAQPLYDMQMEISKDGQLLDRNTQKIGLRTIRVVQQPDSVGASFYFEVNGRPIFAKGSNWIPGDNFLPRFRKPQYEKLMTDAVEANMNMIRIWGGGIYEDDAFYQVCDSLGILVWQDFMFACAMYPSDNAYLESVRAEAIDNVKRLRNHASLAIWCGNNEMTSGWHNWGWKNRKSYTDENKKEMWDGYTRMFFEMLPEIVNQYDSQRFYWASSPSSSFTGIQNNQSGDVHYWKYRGKKLPISVFRTEIGRFMSEYGFNCSATSKTVDKYTEEQDRDFLSPVYKGHVKSGEDPELTIYYMDTMYRGKTDFYSMIYISQLFQADALKFAIEQHRLNMPYCMGSLYWQLNDCWPCSSWSSVDYYGEWKASHYFVKKAFERTIVVADVNPESGMITTYGITDGDKVENVELSTTLIDFNGNVLNGAKQTFTLGENTSTKITEGKIAELLGTNAPTDCLLTLELKVDGKVIAENIAFFCEYKDMKLPASDVKCKFATVKDGIEVELTSDTFVRGVEIAVAGEGVFVNDNFFDLLPKQTKKVFIKGDVAPKDITVSDFSKHKK